MPIYEYECGACKEVSEILQQSSEGAKRKCPECGALKLVRIISQISYHDTYSPMHPRRGRGKNGAGRVDPGSGFDFGGE